MLLHRATKRDYSEIRCLYKSAFPRNERAPLFFIRHRAAQNRAEMLVAEDNGEFVGFLYTVCSRDLVYLFYFAVAENKRGNGRGGEILRLLQEYYQGKKIFLAREPLDTSADNSRERERRHSFYIRNGFTDMPFQVKEASVTYDIMSTSRELVPSDYDALIRNWAGKHVLRLIKMESVG